MTDLNEMLERLEIVERREKIAEGNLKELERIKNMPFHEKIQLKGFEIQLQRVEATQRWTMEKIIKKRCPELLPEWKDLFAEFFMGFLKGKYKSINQYLKENGK